MAIETLKNFNVRDVEAKMEPMQIFNNSDRTIEKFMRLKDLSWRDAYKEVEGIKFFLDRYEILEEPYVDKETGMSALVIGNKETKNVEIIFGASQDPSRIVNKDTPRELIGFEGSEEIKRYIEKNQNGLYTRKD